MMYIMENIPDAEKVSGKELRRLQLELEHRCAQKLLQTILNEPGKVFEVSFDEKGNAYTDDVYISAAHSQDCVLVAAALFPIGASVKEKTLFNSKVLHRFLSGEEVYYILVERELPLKINLFWRYWTTKAAILKCRGGDITKFRETSALECPPKLHVEWLRSRNRIGCIASEDPYEMENESLGRSIKL